MPTALSSATPPPSPGSAPLQFQHLAFITVRIKSAALRHTEPLGTSLPRKPPSQRSQPAAARATAAGPPRAAGPAPPHGLPPPPERGVTSAMGAESRPSPRPGYLAVSLPSPLTPRQDRYRRLGSARLGPARPGSAPPPSRARPVSACFCFLPPSDTAESGAADWLTPSRCRSQSAGRKRGGWVEKGKGWQERKGTVGGGGKHVGRVGVGAGRASRVESGRCSAGFPVQLRSLPVQPACTGPGYSAACAPTVKNQYLLCFKQSHEKIGASPRPRLANGRRGKVQALSVHTAPLCPSSVRASQGLPRSSTAVREPTFFCEVC